MAMYTNLTADQGSTFDTTITITDNQGSPIDLTGYTFAGQIRKTYSSSTAISFNFIPLALLGDIQLNLTAAQTDSMKAGRYVYDFEITSPENVVTRVLEGQLEITPSVTKV
jgi:hypothetical protein